MYRSRADSVASVRTRLAVDREDNDLRVVVSLNDRQLWAIIGPEHTLLTAPIAVSTDETLEYAGSRGGSRRREASAR